MALLLRALIASGFGMFAWVSGCGTSVPEASCSACGGASYSADECESWGKAAGCESASFFINNNPSAGCSNGCSFKDCERAPECREGPGPLSSRDAAVDASVDPRCAHSQDGLFASDPPCDDADEFMLNGAPYSYCPCSGGCPCGYTCGSIPLSVGGSIGSACAPQQ